jgi:uncharacterized membrane protein
MDDRVIMLVLRLLHILSGIFWVGATLTMVGFLVPAMRATGPEGGRFMQQVLQGRRLQLWISVAMGLTILSGFGMYARLSAITDGAFSASRTGIILGAGGLLSLLGAILGAAVARPTGAKLVALGQRLQQNQSSGPPSAEQRAELESLQRRIATTSATIATLLVLAAAAMAVARYL